MFQPTSLFIIALGRFQEHPCKSSFILSKKMKKNVLEALLPPGLKWLSQRISFNFVHPRFVHSLRNIFANNFLFYLFNGATDGIIMIPCDNVENDYQGIMEKIVSELELQCASYFLGGYWNSISKGKYSVSLYINESDHYQLYDIYCINKNNFLENCLETIQKFYAQRKTSFILNGGHAITFDCESGTQRNKTEQLLYNSFK
jgi:hypothetical protein